MSEAEVTLETVNTLRTDSNTLNIRLSINNPKNLEITKVEIENMDIKIEDNRNEKGKTYITLTANPTKYYDSYQITDIKYKEENEEKSEQQYYLIQEEFYKEITKYEDWQNIDPDSYENYKLLTDLDFIGKQNINHNLKIGKLITEGNRHIIKNINLEATDNYFGLIKECKNKIENINFESIVINCNSDSAMKQIQYIGVVAFNSGDILNVDFNKINININNKSNYLGCIGKSTGYEITNVNLNEVYINGKHYLGGLFGNTLTGEIKNINASNIHIKTIEGDYIGGLVGLMTTSAENTFENVSIKDSSIEGDEYVGGLIGKR